MTVSVAAIGEDRREAAAGVIARAFGRADEALLVEKLRQAGDLCLELGASEGGELVGHIAFQPLGVAGGEGLRAASLAPLAVLPAHQRRGIGAALIADGLARLGGAGWDIVFVLGDPAYYTRFGFAADAAAPFSAPWSGPHFMARRLSGTGAAATPARLVYPAAFFESVA